MTHHLNADQLARRTKLQEALLRAQESIKTRGNETLGYANISPKDQQIALKSLSYMHGMLVSSSRISDIPSRYFFRASEMRPALAEVLTKEKIHMLSFLAAKPFAEVKSKLEQAGFGCSLALQQFHHAFNKAHQDVVEGLIRGYSPTTPAAL